MMKPIIITALIIIAAYAFFIAGPAISSFFSIFTRKTGTPFREMNIEKSYYAPFYGEMCAALLRIDGLERKKITVRSEEGFDLAASYYPGMSSDTVILVHGYNTVPLNNFVLIADYLHDKGYGILMPDCRAHRESGGKRCTLGLKEQYDLIRWIECADKTLGSENIFIYGMSMGASTVAYASDKITNNKVRGMILDCGFSSPYSQMSIDMRNRHIPAALLMPIVRLLGKLILGVDIKSSVCDSLRRTEIPALFLHGAADDTVPLCEGKANYEACSSEKEMIIVEGAVHTMSFIVGADKVPDAVINFFATNRKDEKYEDI